MNYLLIIIGFILVAIVIYDFTYTTLAPKGAGKMTAILSHRLWTFSLKAVGGKGQKPILSHIGYLLLYLILFTWILMFWLGNTLIIYADPEAIVNQDKEYITGFFDKVYYTGYVISTMGNGDFNPNKSFWQVYVAFLSFTGLVFITLAISYIVPVLNAASQQRALITYISSIGENPQKILKNNYNGTDFKSLEQHLTYIHDKILMLIQQHQAYPVLHFFHSSILKSSTSVNIASLDEVLTILLYAVKDELRPKNQIINPVRKALTEFLETLSGAFIEPAHEAPEIPNLNRYPDLPIDNDKDRIKEAYEKISHRRKVLKGYLENSGWSWENMIDANYSFKYLKE